ncbi:hypothetical protein P153DRAFT_381115 [Dothidotthia symphoricarpi CBS 119687]|uniref:Uncharacterized protein n=1 Tax=Dothidotthia symphoricarpi CBS 119687 TaxID=1392245 RepID=A0A6A6ARW4_9PLEO|nr:uncharacterized protein P153DRAFT_381115 [Dothidotthia symphoricarpi CBS 119687]KAF2133943.1 hypothetical protein P153DRAFT_381115 [Dothidotthia symphoricarpi CBS 119687]
MMCMIDVSVALREPGSANDHRGLGRRARSHDEALPWWPRQRCHGLTTTMQAAVHTPSCVDGCPAAVFGLDVHLFAGIGGGAWLASVAFPWGRAPHLPFAMLFTGSLAHSASASASVPPPPSLLPIAGRDMGSRRIVVPALRAFAPSLCCREQPRGD